MNASQSEFYRILMQRYKDIKTLGNSSYSNASNTIQDKSVLQIFYVISTILIVIFGIFGNSLCIYDLIHKKVLQKSSAQYFGVFCVFDILVLLFYVFPEWLNRGLSPLFGIEIIPLNSNHALCQFYLLLSYWLRFISAWSLAVYSVDRYVGMKNPQYRRSICGNKYNIKVIAAITIISLFVSIWKPYLSSQTSETLTSRRNLVCAGDVTNIYSNFIYDAIYGCLITIIPSIIILGMNMLIALQLFSWQSNHNITRHELIGFQFAALLVLISSSFLFLCWPYFIFWIHSWWRDHQEKSNLDIHKIYQIKRNNVPQLITRILFYLHFGINIFLYRIASKYFKSQIKHVFTLRKLREEAQEFYNNK